MMYTTNAHDAFLGRTANIEYDNAIEYAGVLVRDEDDTKDILPGMVVKHVGDKQMTLYDGTGTPFGLAAIFVAPNYGRGGINQLGPNGEFTAIVGNNTTTVRINVDALDQASSFAVKADGTKVPVYANADGRISMTGTAVVGHLLEVAPDNKSIVIQLADPAVAA